MNCVLRIQDSGTVDIPADIASKLSSDLIELRFHLRKTDTTIEVGLILKCKCFQKRKRLLFPKDLLTTSKGAIDAIITSRPDLNKTANRSIIPYSQRVLFEAKVRYENNLIISVPPIWYRGMLLAGWKNRVQATIRTKDGQLVHFDRELSVRNNNQIITLCLPKRACKDLINEDDQVYVELTPYNPPKTYSPDRLEYMHRVWKTQSTDQRETELSAIVEHYLNQGFPWTEFDRTSLDKDVIEKVRKSKITIKDDTITSIGYAGQSTCSLFHTHRFQASSNNQLSVFAAFQNKKALTRAVKFQLEHGDPVTPKRMLRALSALLRGPLNFPPTLARWLVDEYAPMEGIVLDPCSGYGGRLLGSIASHKNVHYIGSDIEEKSVEANKEMAAAIEVSNRVTQSAIAVENVSAYPKADLALIGPPYFDRENYGRASREALKKYPTYKMWIDGFLQELVRKTLEAVPVAIFNVAPVRAGPNEYYDLPSDVIELASTIADVERTLIWKLAKFGTAREEKLIVLRRRSTQ